MGDLTFWLSPWLSLKPGLAGDEPKSEVKFFVLCQPWLNPKFGRHTTAMVLYWILSTRAMNLGLYVV